MNILDKALVVDDDVLLRAAICEYLTDAGFETAQAGTAGAAIDTFRRFRPDVVIIDHCLPDGNAIDLMRRIRLSDPDIPVIILTGHGSIDLAVQAIKDGAEQFLTKPVELSALGVVAQRAIENHRNRHKLLAGSSRQAREAVNPFSGGSTAIRELHDQAEKVARADYPVLIMGETGAGKGVLARWIHEHSNRSREAFVDLNCAGFARELLETELFGHERGAFTGATNTKIGLFEVAHRGSIFLDEIGDMELTLQPKLLKVLEDHRFRRVGDTKDREIDVRLIAATHQDVAKLVREKKFRADLYFRINTVVLRVPSLRERPEDLRNLAECILARTSREIGRGNLHFDESAFSAMKKYSWPGNVRELRNVIERAALLCDSDVMSSTNLQFEPAAGMSGVDMNGLTLDEMERLHIQRVLAAEKGHVARAATRLGIPRSTLYYKLKMQTTADGESIDDASAVAPDSRNSEPYQ